MEYYKPRIGSSSPEKYDENKSLRENHSLIYITTHPHKWVHWSLQKVPMAKQLYVCVWERERE